jgi:hypothetical protein
MTVGAIAIAMLAAPYVFKVPLDVAKDNAVPELSVMSVKVPLPLL